MLWDALAGSAHATATRPAIVARDVQVSYAELFDLATRLADVLAAAGVGPGHVVLAYLDNTPAFLVALCAAARLHAAFAPIDLGVTDAEATALLALAGSDLVICDPGAVARVQRWTHNTVSLSPRGDVAAVALASAGAPSVAPTTGIMQFSSGTTAASKGILLGHEALYYRSFYLARAIGLHDGDRTLCALPLSHTHGAECLALPTLLTGGTLFLESPRFAFPLYILEELARKRITFYSSIPQFYDVAVKLAPGDAPDLSALRLPFCGSAALARATAEAFYARYGVRIRQGYGLAELSVICVNMREDTVYDSVGVPLDGIEWRLADGADGARAATADLDPTGDSAPAPREGELLVRSKAMFTAYINAPEATAERLRDGWLHTGDMIAIGDDGLFRIVGRKEDFVKVNGLKVYTSEVEGAIIALPWIAECAVLGDKDALGGESLTAHVVVRDDRAAAAVHADLVRALRATLSDHKLPKRTVVWPALPKSPLGKIQKAQIRTLGAPPTDGATP